MAMDAGGIERMIRAGIPDAQVTIRDLAGDGDHYAATVIAASFKGKSGVPYKGLNVLENEDLRNGIKGYSNWPTIPQLYVKGEFVGGCDIVREMFQAGELQSLMKEKGLPVKEAASA